MTSKKEITPVLIYVDEIEFNRHLHMIRNRLIPVLNKVKSEFLKLGLGQLTNEYLEDILFGDFKLIKEKLTAQINSETPSRFLTGEAVSTANKLMERLSTALEEITSPGIWNAEFPVLKEFPSVDDAGNIVLTDGAIEDLRELHSTYCITERGLEMMEAHKRAASALNDLYQMGKANIDNLGELFYVTGDGIVVPSIIEYDLWRYAREPKKVSQAD